MTRSHDTFRLVVDSKNHFSGIFGASERKHGPWVGATLDARGEIRGSTMPRALFLWQENSRRDRPNVLDCAHGTLLVIRDTYRSFRGE